MLEVEFEESLGEFDLLAQEQIMKAWLARTVGNAMNEWVRLANQQVDKNQLADYMVGRDIEIISDSKVDLVLIGKYPNDIEEGHPRRDMREWLTDDPNSKGRRRWSQLPLNQWRKRQGQVVKEKPGWYNIIPFSSKKEPTPKLIAAEFEKAGISAKRAKDVANIIRKQVRQQLLASEKRSLKNPSKAQLQKASVQTKKGTQWGARLNLNSKSMREALGSEHKLAKQRYQGMVRTLKVYESKTEDSFTTFRIISSVHGRGQTWMQPAKQGVKIMDQLADYVDKHGFDWLDEVIALL